MRPQGRLPVFGRRMFVFGIGVLMAVFLSAGIALAYTDVSPTDDYAQAIDELSNLGVITGFSDGSFRPNELVTRQQFAKMIVLTLGLPVTGAEVCPFTDVVNQVGTDPLYPSKYVAVCADYGITRGKTATRFDPYANITRAQVMTMVVRAAPLGWVILTEPTAAYYSDPKYRMRLFNDPNHGLNAQIAELSGLLWGIREDKAGVWNPYMNATRGEVAQILWRLRQKMAPPSDLLAYDDFSDPSSGWSETTYSDSSVRYTEGFYRINITNSDIEVASWWGETFDDAYYEAWAWPTPASGSWEYSLVFRLQDFNNFYQLTVMGDGTAQLWKRVGGQWTALSSPISLPPAASHGWRHLQVWMLGGSLIASVDDVSVAEVTDSTFTQGKVGFYANTFDASQFAVYYDEFAVWSIVY